MDTDTNLCEGHESLAGAHMGESVYCDGRCVIDARRARPDRIRPNGARDLMFEIRTSWDDDEWGTTMGWWFAIADVIWHRYGGHRIPADWEYGHSPVCDKLDRDDWATGRVVDLVSARYVGLNGLLYAGRVLRRYADWLKAAGRDY